MMLIHLILPSPKAPAFLATYWIPGAHAAGLWAEVLDRTTRVYVLVVSLEVSMTVEGKVVTIVEAGFVEHPFGRRQIGALIGSLFPCITGYFCRKERSSS